MSATLAVVCDQLRTLGLEDVARWVEHPDAVRELLSHVPRSPAGYDLNLCNRCAAELDGPHLAECPVAAAWRALGDPRGAADIERAHEEALRENERMSRPARGGWVGIGDARSIHSEDDIASVLSPGVSFVRMHDAPEAVAGDWVDARGAVTRDSAAAIGVVVQRAFDDSESVLIVRIPAHVASLRTAGELVQRTFRTAGFDVRLADDGTVATATPATEPNTHAASFRAGAEAWRLDRGAPTTPGYPRASRWVLGANGREVSVPVGAPIPAGFTLMPPSRPGGLPYLTPDATNRSRLHSDARGMEAVEAEARTFDARGDWWAGSSAAR